MSKRRQLSARLPDVSVLGMLSLMVKHIVSGVVEDDGGNFLIDEARSDLFSNHKHTPLLLLFVLFSHIAVLPESGHPWVIL
jgi:hypothetical protein